MTEVICINEEAIGKKSQIKKFKYINEAVEIFEQLIEDYGSKMTDTRVIPCSIKEVNALESKLSSPLKLPVAYKEFLLYGGKEIADTSGIINIFYSEVKLLLNYPNEAYDLFCDEELEGQNSPPEIFFLTEYLGAYVIFLKLNEGNDPPIYTWKEEDGDGFKSVKKSYNSFSEFLKSLAITKLGSVRRKAMNENLNNNNPPRGKQFWIATIAELVQGVNKKRLLRALDFIQHIQLEKAATLSGLDPYSYLEELSGWKAKKGGNEIRFFPPSNLA